MGQHNLFRGGLLTQASDSIHTLTGVPVQEGLAVAIGLGELHLVRTLTGVPALRRRKLDIECSRSPREIKGQGVKDLFLSLFRNSLVY